MSPEKERSCSLLFLGVIDRPQEYEFFQPSSLYSLAGTSPTVEARPLHSSKEQASTAPPLEETGHKRVSGLGNHEDRAVPRPIATRAEAVVGAAQAQERNTGELDPLHSVWSSRPSKIQDPPRTSKRSQPSTFSMVGPKKHISASGAARSKLVAALEPARLQTSACRSSSSSAGPSPHKRPVKLEGAHNFRGEFWIPIINRL